MAMKKKAAAAEPAGESAPMWIVSFADLVTLMMSFFVVLYALKQGGEKQQMEVAAALKATFDPSYPADTPSEWDQLIRHFRGQPGPPYPNAGGNAVKPTDGAQGRDDQVTAIRPGKQIVTGGQITFDQNKTDLDAVSMDSIRQIADKLRGHNNVCLIKGHVSADELPLRPDDPNGMSLSNARAMRVIDELVKLGVDRSVLRPLACGPYEPLKTGVYTSDMLARNRRVEVYATENTASEYFPVETVPATSRQDDTP